MCLTGERRRQQDASRAIALVALACLALGILWSLQVTTRVTTYEQVIERDPWLEKGAFAYEPLLADGSGSLAMGEPGYFLHEAPTARVRFAWALDDPEAQRVTALGTMRLVVHHDAAQGRAAWTHDEELASATLAGGPEETLALEGIVDFAAVEERIEATPGRSIDGATWVVLVQVRFASAPVAAHAADASAFEMPIDVASPLYAFPGADALSLVHDHTERERVTRAEAAGPAALASSPAGPILVLVGLGALLYALPRLEEEVHA